MALKFLSTHPNKTIICIKCHLLYHQNLLYITCLSKPSSKERAKINVSSVFKDGALGRCLPSTKSLKFIFFLVVGNISFLHIYPSPLGQNRLLVNWFFCFKKSCDCSQLIDLFPSVPKALPLFWCTFSNGTVALLEKYLQLCDFCGLWH